MRATIPLFASVAFLLGLGAAQAEPRRGTTTPALPTAEIQGKSVEEPQAKKAPGTPDKRPPKVMMQWGKGTSPAKPPLVPDGIVGNETLGPIKAPTRTDPKRLQAQPRGPGPHPGGTSMPSLAGPGSQGQAPANLVVELIVPKSHPEGLPGTGLCAEAPPSGGPSTQIRFRVRNTGNQSAAASTTAIHWTGPNDFSWMNIVNTQEIQSGGAKNTYFNIPPGCWELAAHGSCQFLVELDRTDDVAESNEDDNYASGFCMKAGT